MILESVITCPECKFKKHMEMPTDSCLYYYECENCNKTIKPKKKDCCVFCSYGSIKCPPIQKVKYSKSNPLRFIFNRFTIGMSGMISAILGFFALHICCIPIAFASVVGVSSFTSFFFYQYKAVLIISLGFLLTSLLLIIFSKKKCRIKKES